MALLFCDGFDHYGNGINPATVGKWLTSTGPGPFAESTAQFRTGVGSLQIGSNTAATGTSKTFPASGGAIIGLAFRAGVAAFVASDIVQICEGAVVHVALSVTAGGLLTVKRGATVLATGTTVLVLNTWYYLEIKTVIHDTAGTYEVHIDGIQEAALTASGVDTRNVGTTGQWDHIVLVFGGSATGGWFIDDLYVCDNSGAAPRNTFLGPIKIETLLPQTDAVAAGSNAGLTCSTGTDHGALVDEVGPNTTDFNSSATVGLKDTYNYPSMALTGTVYGIQTSMYINKADAVARQVCAVVRSGGTDYDGASVSPGTTFGYLSEVRAQNPNGTVEWTTSAIASIEAGMKVTV